MPNLTYIVHLTPLQFYGEYENMVYTDIDVLIKKYKIQNSSYRHSRQVCGTTKLTGLERGIKGALARKIPGTVGAMAGAWKRLLQASNPDGKLESI